MIAIIMILIGVKTCALAQQTPKLLKVPRVYNALITSDETLLPSQAYPAISPIIRGLQYPLAAPGFLAYEPYHHQLTSGNTVSRQIPNGAIVLSDDGSYSYSVRRENILTADDGIRSSSSSDYFPRKAFLEGNTADGKLVASNQFSAIASTSSSSSSSSFNTIVGSVSKDSTSNIVNRQAIEHNIEKLLSNNDLSDSYRQPPSSISSDTNETNSKMSDGKVENDSRGGVVVNDNGDDYVKNNRPADPNIVDVPPPPLPVGQWKSSKTAPKEYPPPPVGFIV